MEYILTNKILYKLVNGSREKISKYIDLDTVYNNIDNNTIQGNLKFLSLFGIRNQLIERDVYLNKNKLLNLQLIGLDVTYKNVNDLIDYLKEAEDEADKKYIHSKLGFSNYHNKEIYKLYKTVGTESEYVGSYEIKPKGSKEIFMNMISKEVIGNTNLEFALISGLTAILLGYIGNEVGLDTLIIHLVGNSTTGKSTALKLAISCFGYPDTKKTGLYGTYNGTNNALLKKLAGLHGVPYALDEISMSNSSDFSKFIYSLANGNDKERLDKNSELKERNTWLTTVLSNGEKSILDSSNKNAGLQIRVIEFDNIKWTSSAENSETINKVILENYGHIALEFAEFIMKKGKNEIIESFNKGKEEIENECSKLLQTDNMISRRASKYAVILETAKIFSEMTSLKLNINGIKDMLINVEKESIKNRNFGVSVIEFIKQYVTKYSNRFKDKKNTNNIYGDILGEIINTNNGLEIQMDTISFEKMIKEGGYEDKKVVLKELKASGLLNCEKDRYTRSRKNEMGISTEYIVIKLNENSENPETPSKLIKS